MIGLLYDALSVLLLSRQRHRWQIVKRALKIRQMKLRQAAAVLQM